jgi:hypothetical protein
MPPQIQRMRAQTARMPKAQALAVVKTLKRWTLANSLGAFLVLGGIAANNVVHSSGAQSTSTGTSTSSSSSDDESSSGSNFSQSGGYNFGSSSSSQLPVTGSSSS